MKKIFAVTTVILSLVSENAHGETPQGMNWALPKVSVACVRENPGHASELGTQVVMGTPVRVIESRGAWKRIETPEGYKGFVIDNSLKQLSTAEMNAWQRAKRVVVTAHDQTYVYSVPDTTKKNSRVSDVVNGVVLEVQTGGGVVNGCIPVYIPDGRKGYISSASVMDFDKWAEQDCNKGAVLDLAYSLMGIPYLWGGTSTKTMDCSGLTKICYLSQGIILPRNASQQAHIGIGVDKSDIDMFETGDLLLFGNKETGRVNHVGLYIGKGRFIHCSGRVKINSLKRGEAGYTPLELLAVRRLTRENLLEMSVKRHKWYFGI